MTTIARGHGQERVTVGHPVEVSSGGVFTAWHDFDFPGPPHLVWRRFFSNANHHVSALGRGWTTPFFRCLEERDGQLWVTGDEGHDHAFKIPTGDLSMALPGHQLEVRRDGSGFVIRDWGQQRRYFFTRRGVAQKLALSRIEDLSGNKILLTHDPLDRIARLEQPALGRTLQFTYNAANFIQQIDLVAAGSEPSKLVSYEYDIYGNLIKATDQEGGAIRYAYDERHFLRRETNKLGGSFYFDYDESGRCARTWGDGNYLERKLQYDTRRRITRVTDSLGFTKTYFFNAAGTLEKVMDPLGHITSMQFVGGLNVTTDALGFTTAKEYNERGNLIKIIDALGRTSTFEYNQIDRCTCTVDPDGNRWLREYDEMGRLTAFIDPLGNSRRFSLGYRGEIIKETDGEGRELHRRYDHSLRWQEISDAMGHFRCEYDLKGNPVASSDVKGVLAIFETNQAGRLTTQRMADDAHVRHEYNAAGNPVKLRYLNGAVWTFEYDLFGHMVCVTNPQGAKIQASYDTEGRRVAILNERGEEIRDTLDPNGRVIERRYFDGRVERYSHDPVGQRISILRADGTMILRQYDPAGNLTKESLDRSPGRAPGEAIAQETLATYQYNWKGQITKAANIFGEIEFQFDARGRLIGERQNKKELRYKYDKSGKLVEREFVGGDVGPVGFGYNTAGYLQTVRDARGMIHSVSYDETGRVFSRAMRGNFVETITYDERRRPAEQKVAQEGDLLVRRVYEFDASGNLVALDDSLRGKYDWNYDSRLRLIKASRGRQSLHDFAYDQAGNLLQHNESRFDYDRGSILSGMGGTRFEHDANGNLSARRKGDLNARYSYNAKGQLTEIISPDGARYEFGYDPLGRRLFKKGPGGTVEFIWSNRTLAAVTAPNERPVELLIGTANWMPTVAWVGQRADHYVCNHLGVPLEILRAQHGIAWWVQQGPYGQVTESSASTSPERNLRFPGQFHDRETGLYYNNHRYYDPVTSRFLTPDPIGITGGLNLYDYPRDPINLMDPLGLSCPNPTLIEENDEWGYQIHEHDDGSQTITADCSRAFATPKPNGLRDTIQVGEQNANNPPEACLGLDGRVIVMEGTHRSVAAAQGQQMPQDPDKPSLGGVPGRPGYMTYEYAPDCNSDREGVPLNSLTYPPGYPHTL